MKDLKRFRAVERDKYKDYIIEVPVLGITSVFKPNNPLLYKALTKSLSTHKMLKPILITHFKYFWLHESEWTQHRDQLGCVVGNQRLKYAITKEYDTIDCIFVKSVQERDYWHNELFIHGTKYPL